MRHGHRALVGSLAATLLLGACMGNGSGTGSLQARHPRRHHPSTSPATSAPTPSTLPSTPSASQTPTPSVLHFTPTSNGRHSHACVVVKPGGPAQYVYYPVMVRASSVVDLDTVTVDHSDGVQVSGAWVAPSPKYGGTGMVAGWPAPAILRQSPSVQWSQRVPAAGASLEPATGWYNVFLHVSVDPQVASSTMDGVVLTFHDADGAGTSRWVDHIAFKPSCSAT